MEKVFNFLEKLSNNNNREWFEAHRKDYEESLQRVISVSDDLLEKVRQHDHISTISGKKSLKRIYRDIRFSKDKTPYKKHWGGSFTRATPQLRGGYYFHLEPGNSFLIGGFWNPNKDDIKLIRDHLIQEESEYRKITGEKEFLEAFGAILGEQLKKAPKGYDVDNSSIDLLRYKQFLLKHPLSDEEVLSNEFTNKASLVYQKMRPYLDIMSEFLTYDLNGIEIYPRE